MRTGSLFVLVQYAIKPRPVIVVLQYGGGVYGVNRPVAEEGVAKMRRRSLSYRQRACLAA